MQLRSVLAPLLLAASLCAGEAACGAGGANKDESAADPAPTEKVTEQGKSWGGWRWKGKRDDCFFLHDNKCFDSLEKACKAAKCAEGGCQHDESAPAKVTCK